MAFFDRPFATDCDRHYSRKQRTILAPRVLILADQSQATDSWVNGKRVATTIEETLRFLKASFEGLVEEVEVAFASSHTRHNIQYTIVKPFTTPWRSISEDDLAVKPRGYTRIGGGIRHATSRLEAIKHGRRLMIVLTDGKPTDLDPYEGRHGVEDVRQAISEARAHGIQVIPLAIGDTNAAALHRMFSIVRPMAGILEIAQQFPRLLRGQA